MKNILFIALINITFFTSCVNKTNTLPKYGIEPLKLDKFNFNMDFKYFMDNESLFQNNYYDDNTLAIEVEERKYPTYSDNNDTITNYLKFKLKHNKNNIELANYKDVSFETLEFATNDDEGEIYFINASQKKMSIEQIKRLIQNINTDFNQAKFIFSDNYNGEICSLRWKTLNKIVAIFFSDTSCYRAVLVDIDDNDKKIYLDQILKKIEQTEPGGIELYITQSKYNFFNL